jgi:hypothetical protein
MHVHATRHDQLTRRIDDLSARGSDILANLENRFTLYPYVSHEGI